MEVESGSGAGEGDEGMEKDGGRVEGERRNEPDGWTIVTECAQELLDWIKDHTADASDPRNDTFFADLLPPPESKPAQDDEGEYPT